MKIEIYPREYMAEAIFFFYFRDERHREARRDAIIGLAARYKGAMYFEDAHDTVNNDGREVLVYNIAIRIDPMSKDDVLALDVLYEQFEEYDGYDYEI